MAGAHDGHRSRMRERFRREGLNGFADHEALELMLFYAIPQRNVNPLAHALLERFGSFHGVLEASEEELCRVEGVGEYAATLLRLFAAVGRRVDESRAGQRESSATAWRRRNIAADCWRAAVRKRFTWFVWTASCRYWPTYRSLQAL